jgi:hypothetical protein
MVELLTASVVLNLFVIWRFANLFRKYMMISKLLFEVSQGNMTIKSDEGGVEIKVVKP